MLIGDSVDVDVDEPAVTVRWTLIGCGSEFVLPGSEGTHGSKECGLPSTALNVFVDRYVDLFSAMYLLFIVSSSSDPEITYDPTQFPTANNTGQRIR